jgi:hypothetical protein
MDSFLLHLTCSLIIKMKVKLSLKIHQVDFSLASSVAVPKFNRNWIKVKKRAKRLYLTS